MVQSLPCSNISLCSREVGWLLRKFSIFRVAELVNLKLQNALSRQLVMATKFHIPLYLKGLSYTNSTCFSFFLISDSEIFVAMSPSRLVLLRAHWRLS